MTDTTRTDGEAPLHRDVRLLGEILGRVIVEQEGEELLHTEERIRALSRAGRAGSPPAELREAVQGLDLETQGKVLRAFATYFQLANLAEQHHRLRRRREYEHEERVPRESLAEAFDRLEAAGVSADELAAAAEHVSLELVFTAHPTEATRRTFLAAHVRIADGLTELDDPRLPRSREAELEAAFAEEITALWQTDEVREQRPRVLDEIRHGLWFFEESLWEAAPRLLAAYRERLPARRCRSASARGSAATRTATRPPGRRPPRRRSTSRARSRWRATATRCARWPASWACRARSSASRRSCSTRSRATNGSFPTTRSSSASRTRASRTGASCRSSGGGCRRTATRRRTSSRTTWRSSTRACGRTAAHGSQAGGWRRCGGGSSCSASTSPSSTCGCTRRTSTPAASGSPARSRR